MMQSIVMYLKGMRFIKKFWRSVPRMIRGHRILHFPLLKTDTLGMDTLFFFIGVNTKYCEVIAQMKDKEFAKTLLKTSFGHEITHSSDKYYLKSTLLKKKEKYRFFCNINEVHADFGGAYIFEITVRDAVKAMEYKRGVNGDKKNPFQPAWSQRIEYISTGKYDAALVRRVADDMHYTNETAIAEAEGFYPDIVLKNGE